MIVEPLHRHPHLARPLAERVHAEFGHHYDPAAWDLEAARREFEIMTDPAAHDATWVAFDGPGRELADVAGSVSLIADEDLPGFEHVTAWLANLVVTPDRRGAGVGRLLVHTVEDDARRRGLDRLHLFTEEQVGYYLPLGWRPLAPVPDGRGHVLVKRLDPTAARRALTSRWATDPDVGGAYSYLRVGGRPEHRDVLAGEILPGLLLAGEATSRAYPATLHGAWFSGERAARQLGDTGRVLVVGAGVAGIAAARGLAAHGSDVVVVERLTHIGGRARVDDSLGVTVPLGGAWFHGVEGHPLRDLVEHRPDEWAYDHTVVVDHGWVTEPDLDAARAIRADLFERLERATGLPHDSSVAGLVEEVLADHATASPLALQVARRWIVNVFESLYAAPLGDISTVAGFEDYELPGGDHFVTGNLQLALDGLAEGLDIRLGHRVATLTHRDGAWHTDTGLTADAVVVTIPIGALRAGRIAFDPPLPPPVRDAIDHLGAGPVTKVFATYDRRWWPTSFRTTRVAGHDAPFVMAVDVSDVAGHPTLCWFAVGDDARRLEAMSEDELCVLVDDIARRSGLFDPPKETP